MSLHWQPGDFWTTRQWVESSVSKALLLQSYCDSLVVNRCIFTRFWNAHLNCLSTRCDLTTFLERLRETKKHCSGSTSFLKIQKMSTNISLTGLRLEIYLSLEIIWNCRCHWKNHSFETKFMNLKVWKSLKRRPRKSICSWFAFKIVGDSKSSLWKVFLTLIILIEELVIIYHELRCKSEQHPGYWTLPSLSP